MAKRELWVVERKGENVPYARLSSRMREEVVERVNKFFSPEKWKIVRYIPSGSAVGSHGKAKVRRK